MADEIRVGVIGYGWVGKAMKELFPVSVVYDPALKGTVIAEDDRYVHEVVDDKDLMLQELVLAEVDIN